MRGFRISAFAAVICAFGFAPQAHAADTFTLKVTTFLPPQYVIVNKVLKDWGAELEQKSGGRLKLEVFPSSQMGPPQRQFDLARTGVADIAVIQQGVTTGRFPLSEIVQLPFLAVNARITSEVTNALAKDYLAKEYAGTKVLWLYVTSPIQLQLRSRPLRKVEDFKGMRLRHLSQVNADILTAFGATSVNVMPGDMAEALDKGTVDGVALSYDGLIAFRLGNVVRYSTALSFSCATFGVVMNENTYRSLPDDLRKLIDDTTGERMARISGDAIDQNDVDGIAYAKKSNIEITNFDDAEIAKAKEMTKAMTEKYLAGLEAKGLPARAVYKRAIELTEKFKTGSPAR